MLFRSVLEGQDIVNKTKQGDAIKKITIVRNGENAKKFTASQSDFNKLSADALKAAAARKEAAFADQIKTIEKNFANFEKNADGIYYKIKKAGSGEKTGKGKKVSVDYKGYLIDGRVFDSSEGRAPLSFTTAAGQMIPGFRRDGTGYEKRRKPHDRHPARFGVRRARLPRRHSRKYVYRIRYYAAH